MLVYRSMLNLHLNTMNLPITIADQDISGGLWICNNQVSKYLSTFIPYELDIYNRIYMIVIDNGLVKIRKESFVFTYDIYNYTNIIEFIKILDDIHSKGCNAICI